MNIIGISCLYHDAAACLYRDGEIVAAAEEERFTRRKHDDSFPVNAIRYCLDQGGIAPGEVDHVVFYEKPLLKFERILSSMIDTFPSSGSAFARAMEHWLTQKLWTRGLIRKHLPAGALAFSEHHISHAASAFLVSPFEEAAILTADGVGEWTTTAVGVGRGGSLELLREIRFPHSLGLFYSAFTAYLGFEVNEGEYKVMGLAAYGRPNRTDEVRRLIDVAADGSFQLDMSYFGHHRSLTTFSRRFVEHFGPARHPEAEVEQRYADLAASVQQVLGDVLVRIATDLRRTTGLSRLAMAGGVALNGLANRRILREAGFDEVFIQPAAGDSGGAIGAAAYLAHSILGEPRTAPMRHAYLGPEFGDHEISGFLRAHNIDAARYDDGPLVERVADLLAAEQVVGWHRGRSEFGPRALGARSILASPRRAEMKDIINEKIKHRERFRPFAPSVPVEDAGRYFELDHESPYMLFIVPVRPERRAEIPAVTHEDGTARVQTVDGASNPLYYDLLRAFGRRTGTPVLVNTSFNVRGEPIVNTPAEAYNCFAHTGIDHLVLGNWLLGPETKRMLFPSPTHHRADACPSDVIL